MPTVPVYVSANLARQLAARWGINHDSDQLLEVVRSLVAETLDSEAGISHPAAPFASDCIWATLHRPGHRCRHCGGG